MSKQQEVKILYKNYKGEISTRTIIPKEIKFLSSEWHPEEQWCLIAHDVDKNAERTFVCKDIMGWWTSQ